MSCLTDYIGIRICESQEAPGSGVYINSLPGISLQSIDGIANDDQVTYAAVWTDVQTEAFARFETDFMVELNKCYNLNPYCDYDTLLCNNKRVLLQSWKYLLGNQLMLFRLYSTRLNRFTIVELDDAQKMLDFYHVEYEKNLSLAMKLIELGDCELCCGGNPQSVVWLP